MKQSQALRVMLEGSSVFLTGEPGSGKTYTLNKFIRAARASGKTIAITATTGIAATHISGTTIHSWSGLGIRNELSERDKIWLAANERLSKRYNNADVLVIDEVSMLHGKRLDMVNEACKLLRGNIELFGGLQVILSGDLFQLPPINYADSDIDFAHTSKAWQELNPLICYLTEQHRQHGDGLLDLLHAMRRGEVEEEHFEILRQRLATSAPSEATATKLYSHNIDVEEINSNHLAILSTDSQSFVMEMAGTQTKVEQLMKSVLAPEILELKVGAEVMFVANNFADGYVNGTRGVVVSFKDRQPLVKLQRTGRLITVTSHSWALEEDGKELARVNQLPLRLAWAITIHKSQGMSLDSAEIDLSRAFTPGMGYVALSRVRSLEGLYLKGINNMALSMHPDIFSFDEAIQQASKELATTVSEEPFEATSHTSSKKNEQLDTALLNILKTWRQSESKTRGLPAYMVATTKTLKGLASKKPTSYNLLKTVPGVGPKILERYSNDLLTIIRKHQGIVSIPTKNSTALQEFLADRGLKLSGKELEELKEITRPQ